MYIVENLVFYSCAKLDLTNLKKVDELNSLRSNNFSTISLENYWFTRFFLKSNSYLKFEINNFKNIFNQGFELDKYIDSLSLKVHSDGITSLEIYFKIDELKIISFDELLDKFTIIYLNRIFELVHKINLDLEEQELLSFSSNYMYATLLNREKNKNINIKDLNKNSFSFRVHCFLSDTNSCQNIKDFYSNENINSKSTVVAFKDNNYEATIYNSSVLWYSHTLNKENISSLLDLDSLTLKESVIYKKSTQIYTNQLFHIDIESPTIIESIKLFEMHRVNRYFLQKSRLEELNYSENINSFTSIQREIEDFEVQKDIFEKSEENFLEIHEVIENKEKSDASKVIQYILLFLTLFTIFSMGIEIVEFMEVEFESKTKINIDVVSKVEITLFLISLVLFAFYKASKYIKKS
ncbi:hypothetical protein [Arcobacter porcinus]|uniref:Uncharacterized protein n=1 Tax=Arcobacter porcinus TaxID=1935204 RepID=A0ABX2Y9X7_9BACT|nr:hypothetical protein [Arcobacter porcinus]OCL81840.1 hypothetical protein AAW30_01722 [Arcobacter porcinus]OCL87149.1 hypothetical protein AAX30_00918 [Arcobacter porcinus]OCL89764.1 hypothetical protein AAX28_01988 [Arcobacter porcinus]